MTDPDSFLHLARPLGAAPPGSHPVTAPLNVVIQPQVCARPYPFGATLFLMRWW